MDKYLEVMESTVGIRGGATTSGANRTSSGERAFLSRLLPDRGRLHGGGRRCSPRARPEAAASLVKLAEESARWLVEDSAGIPRARGRPRAHQGSHVAGEEICRMPPGLDRE
jgi:hypothetical protein